LGYRKDQAIRKAATQGRNGKGCVILYAAGNEGKSYVNYYAAHPNVIAVGASTSQDHHARYSNQGAELDVVAPSNGHWPILAARAWWDEGDTRYSGNYRFYIDGVSRGNHYKHFGGTSSSTPLVAGICALILSANPDLTGAEVKEILIKTADKVGHPTEYYRGHSRKYGYGRVNALRAVEEAVRRRGNRVEPLGSTGNTGSTVSTGSSPSGTGTSETSSGLFEVDVNDTVQMGWGVQVGAYSNYGGVMNLVSRLKRTYGQPVYVKSINRGGRILYIVIVGAYANIDDARSLQRKLQREFSGAFVKNLRDV
jgi:subtilisin family serine protease